jgi:hypothetical protein
MSESSRRQFLKSSSAVMLSASISGEFFGDLNKAHASVTKDWDSGIVKHILPTVNDTQMLLKVSFHRPLKSPPILKVGSQKNVGKIEDSVGENWSFYIDRLTPKTKYLLNLISENNRSLCQPWALSTFPSPNDQVKNFRLLIYTCAGGHELHNFLPFEVRRKLLQRGLSLNPDAMVANGDHVYWDLLAPVGSQIFGKKPESMAYSGTFDRASKVLGTSNESVLKKACRYTNYTSVRNRI